MREHDGEPWPLKIICSGWTVLAGLIVSAALFWWVHTMGLERQAQHAAEHKRAACGAAAPCQTYEPAIGQRPIPHPCPCDCRDSTDQVGPFLAP